MACEDLHAIQRLFTKRKSTRTQVSKRGILPRPNDGVAEDRNTEEHKAPKDEVRVDQEIFTIVRFLYDLLSCICDIGRKLREIRLLGIQNPNSYC